MADFFNGISCEYEPLSAENIPKMYTRELPILTTDEVTKKLKEAKKKMSMVPGDINPLFYNEY